MKTTRSLLPVLTMLAVMTACSPRVHVDHDEQVNLSTFQTFRFVDGENTGEPNPLYHSSLLDNAIHSEIARQLEARGFRETNKSPDLLVAYHTYTEKKQESVNNYYPMMYGGWGWRFYPFGYGLAPYPYGFWNGYQQTYTYTEGTLIIDVINAKSNVVVWRGSVSDAIKSPAELHKRAVRAVDQIFRKFPVKSNERQNDEPIVSNRNNKKK